MLESTIVAAAIAELNKIPGCVAQKIHGSVYGHPLLDVLACKDGRMFLLEGKQPGKKPTARQEATMRKWGKAGAVVGWFTSAAEAVDIVRAVGQKGDAGQG